MSITISDSHALASIPTHLLHTATGGASSATLPNGEPNALLQGGPAPVSAPPGPFVDMGFARERQGAELKQWMDNANFLNDLQKGGFFGLGQAGLRSY